MILKQRQESGLIITTGIRFDYQIKKGVCHIGNAIEIMKQLQFDKDIVDNL